jgi:hypothetical protein
MEPGRPEEHSPPVESPEPPEPADDSGDIMLPRWAAAAIGLVLIGLASLAVYTGVTYRREPLGQRFMRVPLPERDLQTPSPGVPGGPEPGASLIYHGPGGEQIPQPGAIRDEAPSRVSISGEGTQLTRQIRLSARRGMIVDIQPPNAAVYVNNQVIGAASQFANADQAYEFAEEGTYDIRLVAPGHRELAFIVRADPAAPEQLARITGRMQPSM